MPEPGRRQAPIALLFGAASLVLVGVALVWGADASPSPGELALSGGLTAAALASCAFAGAAWSRRPIAHALGWGGGERELGGRTRAALVVGALGLSMALDGALGWTGAWEGSRLEWLDRLLYEAESAELMLLFFGLAIGPGIAEELLFRGLLLGALTRRRGVAVGVLASSLLFGAIHFDAAQGTAAAVIGVYLGCVVVVTGSVRTAVVAHVANNAIAVLDAALIEPGRLPGYADAVALALGVCLALPALHIIALRMPPSVARFEAALCDDDEARVSAEPS